MSTHHWRGKGSHIWDKEDYNGDTGKLLKSRHIFEMYLTHTKPTIARANFFNHTARLQATSDAKMTPVISDLAEQKYVIKTIKVVSGSAIDGCTEADLPKLPSIANIWADADPNIKPKRKVQKAKPAPDIQICQHLRGPEYETYIRLVRTRSLGGISPELHARVVRQCFPYKTGFPELGQGRTIHAKGKLPLTRKIPSKHVPENGDKRAEEKYWTAVELQQLDHYLLGLARWEVNHAKGFVKATHCLKTTENVDGVCDECCAVAEDESLKRTMRRVSYDRVHLL